jgi:hypothetical protein
MYVSVLLSLDGFPWNLVLETLTKIYSEKSQFGYNRTKVSDILHEDLSVFRVVGRDIYICSTTIHRTHCCAPMSTLSVFIALLTSTYGRQQYEGNALLRFHDSSSYANAPKCYVIYMLRIFFKLRMFVLTNQLTDLEANRSSRSRNSPSFYGIRSFTTAFTRACHLSFFWAISIQSMSPIPLL